MVVKLYGALSTSVTTVMYVLKEKAVEFERVDLDFMNNEHKSPEYMEKQPFGQMPCLDDNGFVVYEARAICQYIAAKYTDQGTPNLIPSANDHEAMALFQQAVSIETQHFNKPAFVVTRERITKPLFKMDYDQAVIDEALKEIDAKMVIYDQILAKHRYLAGDTLTLADLFHVSWGTLMIPCGWKSYKDHPNVARWWNEISSRPAWLEIHEQTKNLFDSVF